jgi:TPR repeat protein
MENFGSTTSSVASASPAEANATHDSYVGTDLKDLKKFAAAGNTEAEYSLGRRYATGDGVKQDYHEAMRWFLASAEQGNVKAQGRVAAWMWAGRGVPQNYSKAYYWALLAQAGGDDAGRAIMLNSAPYLSPAQTAAEQKQAENWLHAHHIGQASSESESSQ